MLVRVAVGACEQVLDHCRGGVQKMLLSAVAEAGWPRSFRPLGGGEVGIKVGVVWVRRW